MPDVINKINFSFDRYIYEYIKNLPKIICFLEPNYITIFNYFVTLLLGYLIYTDKSILIIILLAIFRSILDILDGAIARKCDKTTKFGAKLDVLGDILSALTITIIFYIKLKNNIKIFFMILIILGSFVSLDLYINYNIIYKYKVIELIHDNTIIVLPLFILISMYLIKK